MILRSNQKGLFVVGKLKHGYAFQITLVLFAKALVLSRILVSDGMNAHGDRLSSTGIEFVFEKLCQGRICQATLLVPCRREHSINIALWIVLGM
jgi:hypothetical protein